MSDSDIVVAHRQLDDDVVVAASAGRVRAAARARALGVILVVGGLARGFTHVECRLCLSSDHASVDQLHYRLGDTSAVLAWWEALATEFLPFSPHLLVDECDPRSLARLVARLRCDGLCNSSLNALDEVRQKSKVPFVTISCGLLQSIRGAQESSLLPSA